jgi:hypothetical protein
MENPKISSYVKLEEFKMFIQFFMSNNANNYDFLG